MTDKITLYICGICGLHYESRELAEKCEEWCSSHSSCNFEIARQHYRIAETNERFKK